MKKIFILIIVINCFNSCKNENTEALKHSVIDISLNEIDNNNINDLVIGEMVKDFEILDRNGANVQLSQLYKKNKLLLLDFWSSKCIPCRKENPNLINLYQQYHSKGLEIVSVSVDDDKKNWLNAIEQDKLSWIQICDFKSWGGDIPKQFNINETPTSFLINQEGVIVDINLKGEALQLKLKTEFN